MLSAFDVVKVIASAGKLGGAVAEPQPLTRYAVAAGIEQWK